MQKVIATTQLISGIATLEHPDGHVDFVKPGLSINVNDKLILVNGTVSVANKDNQLITLSANTHPIILLAHPLCLNTIQNNKTSKFITFDYARPLALILDKKQELTSSMLGQSERIQKQSNGSHLPTAFSVNNALIQLHTKMFFSRKDSYEHLIAEALVADKKIPPQTYINTGAMEGEFLLNHIPLQAKTKIAIEVMKNNLPKNALIGSYLFDDEGNTMPNSIKLIPNNTSHMQTPDIETHLGFFVLKPRTQKNIEHHNLVLVNNEFYAVKNNQSYTNDELKKPIEGECYFSHRNDLNKNSKEYFISGLSKWMNNESYNKKIILGFAEILDEGRVGNSELSMCIDVGENCEKIFSPTESLIANSYDEGQMLSHIIITTKGFLKGDRLLFLPHNNKQFEVLESNLVDRNYTKNDLQIIISTANGLKTISEFCHILEPIEFQASTENQTLEITESIPRIITLETYDQNGLSDISEGCFNILTYESDSTSLLDEKVTELYELDAKNDDFYMEDEFGELKSSDFNESDDSMYTGTGNLDQCLLDSFYQDYGQEIDLSEYDSQLSLNAEQVISHTLDTQEIEVELFNGESMTINPLTIIGTESDVLTLEGNGWIKANTLQGDLYMNQIDEDTTAYVLLAYSSDNFTLPKACINYQKVA
jgi:hypothetical protein